MNNAEAVNWLINITADIGKIEHQDLWHYEQALSEIREMLKDAPTIEPERKTGRWIPCSERMPEKSAKYLVTALDGFDKRTTIVHYLPRSKSWTLTGRRAYWKVIAWMPLAEPYKGGDQK